MRVSQFNYDVRRDEKAEFVSRKVWCVLEALEIMRDDEDLPTNAATRPRFGTFMPTTSMRQFATVAGHPRSNGSTVYCSEFIFRTCCGKDRS